MSRQSVSRDFQAVSAAAPGADTVRMYADVDANGLPLLHGRSLSGRAQAIQRSLARIRPVIATALGDSVATGSIGINPTAVGNPTVAAVSNAGFWQSQRRLDILQTSAATNNAAGIYTTVAQFMRGNAAGRGGFHFCIRWGCATGQAATTRGFCGFSSVVTGPTDVDPSTLTDVLGMGWDTADSSVQIMSRTGSGTTAKVSLSGILFPIPSADNTTVFDFEMYCPPNGSTVYYRVTNLTTGSTVAGSISSDLPADNTLLAPRCYMSVGGVSSVIGITFMNLFIATET